MADDDQIKQNLPSGKKNAVDFAQTSDELEDTLLGPKTQEPESENPQSEEKDKEVDSNKPTELPEEATAETNEELEPNANQEPETVQDTEPEATNQPIDQYDSNSDQSFEDKTEEDKSEDEEEEESETEAPEPEETEASKTDVPGSKWYVIHTYSGHENRVANALKQRIESEHLEHKILDILVPTQEKIEIRSGKKEQVKEKIFPGYLMVKMLLDENSWLAVRTTPGVTSFVGIGNKPTPIPESEVKSIVTYMTQGAAPTFKDVFLVSDTVKIIDGPFADFIGKVDSVDKEKGKVRVLVSIFGRETPVELDFLQITKL